MFFGKGVDMNSSEWCWNAHWSKLVPLMMHRNSASDELVKMIRYLALQALSHWDVSVVAEEMDMNACQFVDIFVKPLPIKQSLTMKHLMNRCNRKVLW